MMVEQPDLRTGETFLPVEAAKHWLSTGQWSKRKCYGKPWSDTFITVDGQRYKVARVDFLRQVGTGGQDYSDPAVSWVQEHLLYGLILGKVGRTPIVWFVDAFTDG